MEPQSDEMIPHANSFRPADGFPSGDFIMRASQIESL